ncbi:MAG: DUF4159 domain-containing protein [Candidatus Latescibacterota bacterium]
MSSHKVLYTGIAILLLAGIVSAQPRDDFQKGATGIIRVKARPGDLPEARIAAIWGERFKPPVTSIIDLREAIATWTEVPVTILKPHYASSPDIQKLPVIFIHEQNLYEISPAERRNLREYIEKGGFVVAYGVAPLQEIFSDISGGRTIEPLSPDHPIFCTPFPLGTPKLNGVITYPQNNDPVQETFLLEEAGFRGVFIEDRLAVLYSPLGYSGDYSKFGVNLVMYALEKK